MGDLNNLKGFVFLVVFCFWWSVVFCDDLHVDQVDNTGNPCTLAQKCGLREAILSSNSGDRILVYPGLYKDFGNITLPHNITVEGESSGEARIVGSSQFRTNQSINVIFRNLKFSSLKYEVFFSSVISRNQTILFEEVVFGDTVQTELIYLEGFSMMHFSSCTIYNISESGLRILNGNHIMYSSCKFFGNTNFALKMENVTTIELIDSNFTNSFSTSRSVFQSSSVNCLSVQNSTFINLTMEEGNVMENLNVNQIWISGSLFRECRILNYSGSIIYSSNSFNVSISFSRFFLNHNIVEGEGEYFTMFNTPSRGTDIVIFSGETVSIRRSVFELPTYPICGLIGSTYINGSDVVVLEEITVSRKVEKCYERCSGSLGEFVQIVGCGDVQMIEIEILDINPMKDDANYCEILVEDFDSVLVSHSNFSSEVAFLCETDSPSGRNLEDESFMFEGCWLKGDEVGGRFLRFKNGNSVVIDSSGFYLFSGVNNNSYYSLESPVWIENSPRRSSSEFTFKNSIVKGVSPKPYTGLITSIGFGFVRFSSSSLHVNFEDEWSFFGDLQSYCSLSSFALSIIDFDEMIVSDSDFSGFCKIYYPQPFIGTYQVESVVRIVRTQFSGCFSIVLHDVNDYRTRIWINDTVFKNVNRDVFFRNALPKGIIRVEDNLRTDGSFEGGFILINNLTIESSAPMGLIFQGNTRAEIWNSKFLNNIGNSRYQSGLTLPSGDAVNPLVYFGGTKQSFFRVMSSTFESNTCVVCEDEESTSCYNNVHLNQIGRCVHISGEFENSDVYEGMVIDDCVFRNNSGKTGGAIAIVRSREMKGTTDETGVTYARISNCKFENNIAFKGSALYAEGSIVKVEGSTFVNNTILLPSRKTGSFHGENLDDLVISDSIFGNTTFGSCIFLHESNLRLIESSSFFHCHTEYYGAGLAILKGLSTEQLLCSSLFGTASVACAYQIPVLKDLHFEGCSAELGGGGIAIIVNEIEHSSMRFRIGLKSVVMKNNRGARGGAIYLLNTMMVLFYNLPKYFFQNSATMYGGTFFLSNSNLLTTDGGEADFLSISEESFSGIAGPGVFDEGATYIDGGYFETPHVTGGVTSCLDENGVEKLDDTWFSCVTQKVNNEEEKVCYECFTGVKHGYGSGIQFGNNSVSETYGWGSDWASYPVNVSFVGWETVLTSSGGNLAKRTNFKEGANGYRITVYAGERIDLVLRMIDASFQLITYLPGIEIEVVNEPSLFSSTSNNNNDDVILSADSLSVDLGLHESWSDKGKGEVKIPGLSFIFGRSNIKSERVFNFYSRIKLSDSRFMDLEVIEVSVLPCPPGYKVEVQESVDHSYFSCKLCPEGWYSISVGSSQCHSCPPNADCKNGNVWPREGYWAYRDEDEGTVKVIFCANPYCLGGDEENGLNHCSGNRDENQPLCAACLEEYDEWNGNCVNCSNFNFWSFCLIVLFLLFLVVQVFTIHKNSQSSESSIERLYSFFGVTYKHSLRNVDWGTLTIILTPILSLFTSLDIPVGNEVDLENDDTTFIDYLLYPLTYVLSKIFICPFPNPSYLIIWRKFFDPIVFIFIVTSLLVCCSLIKKCWKLGLCTFFSSLFWVTKTRRLGNKYNRMKKVAPHPKQDGVESDLEQQEKLKEGKDGQFQTTDGTVEEEEVEGQKENTNRLANISGSLISDDVIGKLLGDEKKPKSEQHSVEETKEKETKETEEELVEEVDEEVTVGNNTEQPIKPCSHLGDTGEEESINVDNNSEVNLSEGLSEVDPSENPYEYWVYLAKKELEYRGNAPNDVWNICMKSIGCSCVCCVKCCFVKKKKKEGKDDRTFGEKLKSKLMNVLECVKKKLRIPNWNGNSILLETLVLIGYIFFGIPSFLVFLVVRNAVKKVKGIFLSVNAYRLTFLNLTIITYQAILENALSLINCVDVGGESRNRRFSDVSCWDTAYSVQFFILVLLPLFYCTLYPIVLLFILTFNKRRLYEKKGDNVEQHSFSDTFGMFYLCYRKNCWWYEIVSVTRKMVMVIMMTFSSNFPVFTDFSLSFLLVLNLVIHVILKPYKISFDNFLEGLVLGCLVILQLIRTSLFFVDYTALALLIVLASFTPVFVMLTYLKFRISILFIVKHLEKLIIRKIIVTCFLYYYPQCLLCTWCFCFERDVSSRNRSEIGLGEEREQLLGNDSHDDVEEELLSEEEEEEDNEDKGALVVVPLTDDEEEEEE